MGKRRVSRKPVHEFRRIAKMHGVSCVYCFSPMAVMTADHYVPVSRGGANDLTNLVPSCRECQQRKADKLPEEALTAKQIAAARRFIQFALTKTGHPKKYAGLGRGAASRSAPFKLGEVARIKPAPKPEGAER